MGTGRILQVGYSGYRSDIARSDIACTGYVRPSAGPGLVEYRSVEYRSDSNDPQSDNHQENTKLGKSWA